MPAAQFAPSEWFLPRRHLAEAVVARQYELRPELRTRYGPNGYAKCVSDTEFHLAYLASALATHSPALFTDYLVWANEVMNAHGVHTEDFVENLRCLLETLEAEALPNQREPAQELVQGGIARLLELSCTDSRPPSSEETLRPIARQYLQALLNCDRLQAHQLIVQAIESGMPIREIYLEVFQRCQREIGRLWQQNQVDVAQEHYCTAVTQQIMASLYPRLFTTLRVGKRVVIACIGGELHEIGARMVADFFEMEGWESIYLGANTPRQGIVKTLVDRQAQVLAISATMTFHLTAVVDLIQQVRATPDCAGVKILVGGYPFLLEPGLWQRVGADGTASDAPGSVQRAEELLQMSKRGCSA